MGGRRFSKYARIRNVKYLVPIFFFAIYDSAFSAFSSMLARLSAEFPDVPVTVVQMVLTVPSLIFIPVTLVAGFLAAYIRKKFISSAALLMLFVGGMLPFVYHESIYVVFASSALIGMGQGMLHPFSSALVCEFYEDNEKATALGYKQAANYIGAAVIALLVGNLAMGSWSDAYLVYLGVIPVIFLTMVLLPRGKLDKKLIEKENAGEGLKDLFNPTMVYYCILFACATVCLFAFHTNIAMLVSEKGIGDSADISVITSMNYLVSFAVGLIYGRILDATKRYTLSVGFFVMACGMLVAGFGGEFFVLIVGGLMFGAGCALQEICTIFYVSQSVKKHSITMAISLVLTFVNIGVTFSPLVINGLQALVFDSLSAFGALVIAASGFVVLGFVEIIHQRFLRQQASRKSSS